MIIDVLVVSVKEEQTVGWKEKLQCDCLRCGGGPWVSPLGPPMHGGFVLLNLVSQQSLPRERSQEARDRKRDGKTWKRKVLEGERDEGCMSHLSAREGWWRQ